MLMNGIGSSLMVTATSNSGSIYRQCLKIAFQFKLDVLFKKLRKGCVFLLYHSTPAQASWTYDVSKRSFEAHLAYLKSNCEILSVPSIVDRLTKGAECDRLVCGITFDDGYKNNHDVAFPLLSRYNIPATIFVSTAYVSGNFGGRHMLSWDELKEMQSSGLITVGSHTHTHRDLRLLTEGEVMNEISMSKRLIEEKLGTEVSLFSYPGGGVNENVRRLLGSTGLRTFSSTPLINHYSQDSHEFGRIAVDRLSSNLPSFAFKFYGVTDSLSQRFRHSARVGWGKVL